MNKARIVAFKKQKKKNEKENCIYICGSLFFVCVNVKI